jgi:hypothetical protein
LVTDQLINKALHATDTVPSNNLRTFNWGDFETNQKAAFKLLCVERDREILKLEYD